MAKKRKSIINAGVLMPELQRNFHVGETGKSSCAKHIPHLLLWKCILLYDNLLLYKR